MMRTQILAVTIVGCLGLAACNQSPTGMPSSQAPSDTSRAEPTVGQKVDDAAITAKVKAALLAAENVNGTHISVETNSGRVVLSGMVPDQGQIDRAVATARNIDGVVDVESRLAVGKG
jgi:hyperosmotically inducible periplasmic protein